MAALHGSRRQVVRTVAVVVAAGCVLALAASYLAAPAGPTPLDSSPVTPAPAPPDAATPTPERAGTATPRTPPPTASVGVERRIDRPNVTAGGPVPAPGGVTVVATQGFSASDETAELVAFTRDGDVLYHDSRYGAYFDVDPVPGTRYTVEYVAAQHLSGEACSRFESYACTLNLVERVNLSTGERERVYADRTPRVYSSRWHDVDRVNDTHLAVADITNDRVFLVDVRTDEVTWSWHASEEFSRSVGGEEFDWTHVNDVEVLDDGRLMVSLRNMDQVVFLRPGGDPSDAMVHVWTLGSEDDYDTLYEQHNPDYIPAERGGPAVLVADSENNRVLEYQRENGSWTRAWAWRDVRLQWPRDADRLPGGHTLVVDTHGDRVLEVDRDGSVAWSVHIGMPYDAERLGTGVESDGGYAAGTHPSNRHTDGAGHVAPPAGDGDPDPAVRASPSGLAVLALKDALPSVLVNGLLYMSPSWWRFVDLLVAAVLLVDLVAWGALEWRWSDRSLRVRARFARLVR